MVYTISELKQKIKPIAQKYEIPAVYVFGSYARNEANENSDVDILIEKKGSKISTLFDLGGLYNDLSEILKKNIDLVTTCALNKDDDDFKRYVMNERSVIYE